MSALNAKTQARLERFLDENDTETVDATIAFLRGLGHAERMFAGEWLEQVRAERNRTA